MNDKTAVEKVINRKLDALKAELLSLVFMVAPGVGGVSIAPRRLEEAWKEEDDNPLKIEVNTVTASGIYSYSLGEPSDSELRHRVARLLGATNVIRGAQSNMLMGYWPEEDEGRGEGWKLIEDYPNDITAAMTLVDRLEALGYVFILVNTTNGNLKAVRVIEGGARTFPPKYYLDNLEPPSKASANVQDTTLARAITRAFIEVMEGKDRE